MPEAVIVSAARSPIPELAPVITMVFFKSDSCLGDVCVVLAQDLPGYTDRSPA